MSVDTISEDANIISRLQLAKALKEDIYSENPETSAIFLRQRNRTTKYGVQPPRGSFYIPRPMNLLVPPVLGNAEGLNKDNNFSTPSSQPNSQQFQQDRRPSQPQIYTSSPRNSIIMPEERRGSASKPATLMDVRDSILEVRQNLQNSIAFSTSSSQRTSIILQQNKSLPDTNGKLHGASKLSNVTNSRPNSVVLSPRPVSAYNNNSNSRPTSFYKSNKSDEEDEKKSKEVKEVKKSGSSSSDDSNSAPKLPPIKSVANQSIILEKVDEEDDSSDESEDDDYDDDDDSSEDDTPLALKSTPKIKVAPPRITTRKGSGGRIEAWLEHVSGSPEGPPSRSSTPTHSPRSSTPTHSPRPSTPTHSPRPSTPTRSSTPTHSPTHSPRIRKTSEHSIHQYNSSPLSPHRSSYIAEPNHDARSRRPKSAYFPDNLQAPKPDFNQPRKRSNSEFLPKVRTNSVYEQTPQVPPFPIGRVSPSPRQDSGYWAKDTLIALSDDLRHISLMNDSNSSHSSSSRGRSSSFSNINGGSNNSKLSPANNIAKVANRHRREGSGSSVHNSKAPQLHIQGAYSSPQIPALQTSRSKDTLSVYLPSTTNGNRNSLYINNNNIQKKLSSEQLKANRNSTYSQHKHRIRS